jgi:outer membrane protein assembly factor BamE (lipoprotein component of BamABCDE complex)
VADPKQKMIIASGLLLLFLIIAISTTIAWMQWSGAEKQKLSQWRDGFSQIHNGMSEEEVRKIMGNPTNESSTKDPQRRDIKTLVYSWSSDRMFMIQFDADKKVEEKTETK